MLKRRQKVKLWKNYFSTTCICGKPKMKYRWVCLDCRDKLIQSGIWKILSVSCDTHESNAIQALSFISPGYEAFFK